MSQDPTCPRCGGASMWNHDGTRYVLCPECLRVTANAAAEATLEHFAAWILQRKESTLLSYFNCVAVGLFLHATQFRLDNPDKGVGDSWEEFRNKPRRDVAPASGLFELIAEGHWVDSNGPHLAERLKQIHDASFFGQWAVPIKPPTITVEYTLDDMSRENVELMLNGKRETHKGTFEAPVEVCAHYGDEILEQLNQGAHHGSE